MHVRIVRKITVSMLGLGLVAWSGCGVETAPDGTPTTLQKIEKKAGDTLEKVEEAGAKAGKKIEEVGAKAIEGTGKGIEKAGAAIETSAKDAVKEHIGDKAADVVESAGKGIEKAGEKIQESVKKKD